MTISSQNRTAGPFTGNDTTTIFPFTFKVFQAADLKVVRRLVSTDVETTLVLGTDYSVTLNSNQDTSPGGNVTLTSVLASGRTLTITSELGYLQTTDLTNQGGFYPKVITNALDRLTIFSQQLFAGLNRSLKYPLSDSGIDATLPGKESLKGKVLAFNESTGRPMAGPSVTSVGTVAGGIAAIKTVADNIVDVVTVADNIGDVAPVGQNIDEVIVVADNIAKVVTLADNIDDVQTVAANLGDVTNFAGVYYGPSATDPSTRKDGTPLQQGDLYFNTTTERLRTYTGSRWSEANSGSVTVQEFTGDGVETEFQLNISPENENVVQVFVGGVYQAKSVYSLTGDNDDVLTFTSAPPNGIQIEAVTFAVLPLGVVDASQVQTPGGRTLDVKLSDYPVNGTDFGVVLDDNTLNTPALNALAAAGKKTYIPAGVSQGSNIVPTDNWALFGAGRGVTTLKPHTVNSSIITMSGQFDFELSHMTLTGFGKESVTNENGVTYNGLLNGRRNTFSYLDFSGFSGHCLNFSAGWNNSVYKSRMLSSAIGLNFTESPLLAGWSGSGFKLDESYIATCDVGIQMENIWNFTSINTVIEDCDLPINQTGSATPAVWINNWFESNQQSPELSYSNIFIGGRLEGGESPSAGFYDNMSLPTAPFDYECITELLYGIRVFRDPNDEVLAADGQGVKAFKAHSSLGWAPEDISGSTAKRLSVGYGSGADNGGITSTTWGTTGGAWVDVTTLTGRRHFNSFDAPNMPYLGVKVQGAASSAAGGNGFTRVAISTGSYFTGGGAPSQFADRWQFDENGHLSPFADGSYDIGISGARVRDIRVVNAPIVGSDQRIKKDVQSIPQELLDFALSVEIKQYKLKSGTSGRNHYGIVITPEFLQSLAQVQPIAECGAFCQDVFTDADGYPVNEFIGGFSVRPELSLIGDVYSLPIVDNCNVFIDGSMYRVVDGQCTSEDVSIINGILFAIKHKHNQEVSQLAEFEESRRKAIEAPDKLSRYIEQQRAVLFDESSSLEAIEIAEKKLANALKTVDAVNAAKEEAEKMKFTFMPVAPAVSVTSGDVFIGDIWQVRYDEWQNILLEAMRRKINNLN